MSKGTLRVRVYNVRFGDAVLVTLPDRGPGGKATTRHILIDIGNVLTGAGGDDSVFEAVVDDVKKETGGHPVDLYVMTHEHLDHVQGLLHVQRKAQKSLAAEAVWMTASAEGEAYYQRHEKAREKKLALQAAYAAAQAFLAGDERERDPQVAALLAINNPRKSSDCVDYLKTLCAPRTPAYVFRGCELKGTHQFAEARFGVWAPEEDTSVYYRKTQPMALGVEVGGDAAIRRHPAPLPPAGVDASAFYNLVTRRAQGWFDNLLALDKAENDTSVVFALEWRGLRLLFAGDAEERSWEKMAHQDVLVPVDFLKVGHHGSGNGTPPDAALDQLMPGSAAQHPQRCAAVSTWVDTYDGVPDLATRKRLERKCQVRSTLDDRKAPWMDFRFKR